MKRFKKIVATVVISFTIISLSFAQTQTPLKTNPKVKKGILSNGMDYYILKNKEPEKRVTMGLLVKAGSCMEDEDQMGVAHFIEHMCFNGTEHYPHNEIYDFVESIGMQRFNDLNASTSQRRTFFFITVPTDKKENIEKAMYWLEDIASGNVLFDEEELQKEKGVVIEEWRLDQGYDSRYDEAVINKYYLKDSLFAERDVLGTETSIKNVSSERVKDFYNKWYRSDNMSFFIVGDINQGTAEGLIKKRLSKIEKPESPFPSVDMSIPEQGSDIIIFSDKEQKNTCVIIQEKVQNYSYQTEENVRKSIISNVIHITLNQRFGEIAKQIDSPYLSAGFTETYYRILSNNFNTLYIYPKDELLEQSIYTVKEELLRLKNYGITENELKYIRQDYLSSIEDEKKNINKITSDFYIDEFINSILDEQAIFYPEYFYDLNEKNIQSLTVEEINEECKKLFQNDGDFILLEVPESKKNIATEEKLGSWWKNYQPEVTEYVEEELPDHLMERPKTKSLITLVSEDKKLGCKEYLLENGARILLKKTNFEKDRIYISVYSEGGTSMYEDKDYPSAYASAAYFSNSGLNGFTKEQYLKIISGQNYSLSYNVSTYYEWIEGGCARNDFENMLQYVNAMFTSPYFTDEGWNTVYQNYNETLKKRGITPNDVFYDKINATINKNDFRNIGITQEFIDLLDQKRSEEIYRERFSNAADFTFTFAGDFDETELLDLCCYYLGTIPGDESKKEKTISRHVTFPEGKILEKVQKGEKVNSQVFVGFGHDLPVLENPEEIFKKNKLAEIAGTYLWIKLTDVVREENSGTYGVNVNGSFNNYPSANYLAYYIFGCEHGRETELINASIECLKSMKENPISASDLTKIKLKIDRDYEQNKKKNWWWINRINNIYVDHIQVSNTVSNEKKLVKSWITKETIQQFINEYFDENNNVIVIQEPEE